MDKKDEANVAVAETKKEEKAAMDVDPKENNQNATMEKNEA